MENHFIAFEHGEDNLQGHEILLYSLRQRNNIERIIRAGMSQMFSIFILLHTALKESKDHYRNTTAPSSRIAMKISSKRDTLARRACIVR
jgi:hypothetical protein